MNKPKKVVAYVCDVPVPGTDEVITKADQKARIMKYAQKAGVEVVAVFEDEAWTEDFADRPGVQAALNFSGPHDQVVCERVWAFTRSRADLESLMGRMEATGVTLAATSYLWDCLSQMARHRYLGNAGKRVAEQMVSQAA